MHNDDQHRNRPRNDAARRARRLAVERAVELADQSADPSHRMADRANQIDGVWHDQPPLERELVGDPVLEVIKTLAGLGPGRPAFETNRRVAIESSGAKYTCRFTSQGTQTGERALLQIEGKKLAFQTLEELGMRQKMIDQLTELLKKGGFFRVYVHFPAVVYRPPST